MYGIIYILTNTVTGKVYIGQTKGTLENRWEDHVKCAHKPNKSGRCPKLHNSIRRHGPKAFTRDVLAHAETREDANRLEIEWIKTFDSTNKGYNISAGGVISYTPEMRAAKSKKSKEIGQRPPIPTPEQLAATGRANSLRMKGTKPLAASQARYKPCTVDGVSYPNREAAAKALGISVKTLRGRLEGTGSKIVKVKYQGVIYDSFNKACLALGVCRVVTKKKLKKAGLELTGPIFDADVLPFDLFTDSAIAA